MTYQLNLILPTSAVKSQQGKNVLLFFGRLRPLNTALVYMIIRKEFYTYIQELNTFFSTVRPQTRDGHINDYAEFT